MLCYYVLDEGGNPVPEPDVLKWGKWYETAERHVGNTDFGNISVSTVFLGMPHINKETGAENMLYETMVFADDAILAALLEISEYDDRSLMAEFLGTIDIQKRYATKAEALQGHKHMCTFIEVCLAKGLLPGSEVKKPEK